MRKYFGSLSFYKQALMIGIPVMLQSLIQSLVSLVDNFMVAGLGDVKMSGVSVAGQIAVTPRETSQASPRAETMRPAARMLVMRLSMRPS